MSRQEVAYMVQGFFFQERTLLGIDYVSVDGAVAVVNRSMVRDMFAGLIGQEDDFSDKLTGSLMDRFGPSDLTNIQLDGDKLSFDKTYQRRDDRIRYRFYRDGDLWIGRYSGELVGEGSANCILTEMPGRMLQNLQ